MASLRERLVLSVAMGLFGWCVATVGIWIFG